MRRQFAVGIFDSKILLMITHNRNQNFFRQAEELRIEVAENCRRPLGQIHDGIQQCGVLAPAGTGHTAGGLIQRFADTLFALIRTEHDMSVAHRFNVSSG